jgi:iron complex transport system ATP-binding protein
MPKDGVLIRAHGIGRRDGNGGWLWRGVDLALHPGRAIGLIGRNGGGKTTLIRTLMGFILPHEGRVASETTIGYVPQTSQISFPFTVRDIVEMGRVRETPWFVRETAKDKKMVNQAIEQVGLTGLAQRPFNELSGGERQLTLIARAIATGCGALILDEPFTGLDLENQQRTLETLMDLANHAGMGVLFSTHQPDHLLTGADRTIILRRNDSFLFGPTPDVLTGPLLSDLYGVDIRVLDIGHQTRVQPHAVADIGPREKAAL